MKLYTKESLEELKEKASIFKLIREELSIVGSMTFDTFRCPFCKSGDLIFDVKTNKYFCFDCNALGDPIAFIMAYKKLSFDEACECLAKKFDVKLEKTQQKERTVEERIKRLETLMEIYFGKSI